MKFDTGAQYYSLKGVMENVHKRWSDAGITKPWFADAKGMILIVSKTSDKQDYSKIEYTILYYTILYYTIPYYTLLYYTRLYYPILYYTILYYTIF